MLKTRIFQKVFPSRAKFKRSKEENSNVSISNGCNGSISNVCRIIPGKVTQEKEDDEDVCRISTAVKVYFVNCNANWLGGE